MTIALANRVAVLEALLLEIQKKSPVNDENLEARVKRLEGELKAMKARMGKKSE